MIIYTSGHDFFAMKNDAEKNRISLGLPPAATVKIVIETRSDLVALLNGLTWQPEKRDPAVKAMVPDTVAITTDDIPDCVPDFLKRSWGH